LLHRARKRHLCRASLAVQSEIAQAIVEAVGATLTGPEASAIAAAPTANAGAYRLYLKGREYFTRQGHYRKNMDSAQLLYELALTLDPGFALAHTALSEVHGLNYLLRWDHSPSRAARQREEAEAALRLAPDLPQAHFAMGSWYYRGKRDYPRALSELRIAVDGLPSDAEIWARIRQVTRRMGNWSGSVTAHEKTTQLNPRSADLFRELGVTYLWMRRYAEAITAFDRASSLDPSNPFPWFLKGLAHVHWQGQIDTLQAALRSGAWSATRQFWTFGALDLLYWDRRADSMLQVSRTAPAGAFESQEYFLPASLYTAWAHRLRGDYPAARAAFDSARVFVDSALKADADDERMHAARGLALAGLGRREEALREARWLQQSVAYREDKFQGTYLVEARARILAQIGDVDGALDEIRRLLAGPSLTSVHTLRLNPRWDPIRHDPRFQALLSKYAAH
jgi:tetratricopeptide (TPR) repeat protein